MEEDGEAAEVVGAEGSETEEAAGEALSNDATSALGWSGDAETLSLTSTSEQDNTESLGRGQQQSVIRTRSAKEGQDAELREQETRGVKNGCASLRGEREG